MFCRIFTSAVLAAVILHNVAAEDGTAAKNPIRKVVNMLQAMQAKVQKEGEKEEELYKKFMCFCKTGTGDLTQSISTAEVKVPAVQSEIEASEGKLAQTKEDLKQAQSDRVAAKESMEEATAIREKEAAAFAAEKAEADTNINAMKKAIAALERGMAGGFLQTRAAQTLLRLVQTRNDMIDLDRQEVLAFLTGKASTSTDYAPQSGEVTGILKEMQKTMETSLADSTAQEQAAIKSYEEMMAAKTKEVEALGESIETKTRQIGELGVAIVEMQADLSDTEAALIADQKFLQEMSKSCETKTAEWEERSKTRADELVALAETIKILNDDDALELFKKAIPSAGASLAQLGASASTGSRAAALDVLRRARAAAPKGQRAGLDLLMMMLSGKRSAGRGMFDKVIKMVDNMLDVLKKEQEDDDNKKEYCNTQFDFADDKRKGLERKIEEHENAIATAQEALSTLTEEIKTLGLGIQALDKSVAEATEQRKAENVEYKELMASDAAAKELLNFARNRLNKFYNPKLYVAPAKKELSESDRIAANMGGEESTPAPAEFVQVSARRASFRKDAPPPPPETWGAYSKKSEESTGVVAMLDLLIRDLDKEMTEAETEEKRSQADYERMMAESVEKRSADSKLLAEKSAAKADAEVELQSRGEAKESAVREHMATMKYIASLHSECDWLVQYYDVRKEARAGEVDSLQKAKAVLSGADFSMLQPRSGSFLQVRRAA